MLKSSGSVCQVGRHDRSIVEAARIDSRSLTACIYRGMKNDEGFVERHARRLADYPMELAAAMYLEAMERS